MHAMCMGNVLFGGRFTSASRIRAIRYELLKVLIMVATIVATLGAHVRNLIFSGETNKSHSDRLEALGSNPIQCNSSS